MMNADADPADADPIVLLPAVRRIERLAGHGNVVVEEKIDSSVVRRQGYRISITPEICRIIAHDAAGSFYARQTLMQIRRQFPAALPCVQIEDWPDFPVRGVMLDISRCKVPTMATLMNLIDRLAEWKINHLQLYIEHTFAYAGHEEVSARCQSHDGRGNPPARRILQSAVHRTGPEPEQFRAHGALAAASTLFAAGRMRRTGRTRRGDFDGPGRSVFAPPIREAWNC